MSRRIIGVIINPDGTPLANTQIKLIALQSKSPSITKTNNFTFSTDGSGAYDEDIELGYYKVTILRDGSELIIGEINVQTGSDTTLPSLLELFELPPRTIDEALLDLVAQAEAAAAAAEAAADEAEQVLSDAESVNDIDLSKQNKAYLMAELDVSSLGITPERFCQGMNFNNLSDKFFLYLRTAGLSDKADERFRIIEFDYVSDGLTLTPTVSTPDLISGHQGISIEHRSADPNDIYIWTKAPPHLADTDDNEQTGKHVFRWDYKGASTTDTDAVRFRLYPDYGSLDPLEQYYNCTPAISLSGKYLVVKVSSYQEDISDQRIFIYDMDVINAYSPAQRDDPANFNKASAAYITDWPLNRIHLRSGTYTQAVSCDDKRVFITSGGSELTGIKQNSSYSMGGELLGSFEHTAGHPDDITYNPAWTPLYWEPEGGCLLDKGMQEKLVLMNTRFDDAGTNRVLHQVYGFRRDTGEVNTSENEINQRGSDLHFKGGVPSEITFEDGNTLEIGSIVSTTGVYNKVFVLQDDGSIELHQPDDDSSGCRVRRAVGAGREILELRSNTGLGDGAAINLYGDLDSVDPGEVKLYTGGTQSIRIEADGRVVFPKKGELKLINDEGHESNIYKSNVATREILEIRGDTGLATGAGINLYSSSDPVNPDELRVYTGNSESIIVEAGGRVVFAKKGELKLINDEGHESNIYKSNIATREILYLRGDTGLGTGAGINLYSSSDPVNPDELRMYTGNSESIIVGVDGSVTFAKKGELKLINDEGHESTISKSNVATYEILEIRAETDLATGAGIDLYSSSDPVNPDEIHLFTQGDSANPDVSISSTGRMTLGKRGEIKLVNTEGHASNIYKSNTATREILEIRGETSLATGAGINLYAEGDPTNPGRMLLQPGPSGVLYANGLIDAQSGLTLSGGADTLDSYDEGTWTPTLAGSTTAGSHTYVTQAGVYTKIGNTVIADFYITIDTKDGAMAGNISISGLPFTSGSVSAAGAALRFITDITFNDQIVAGVSNSATKINLVKLTTGSSAIEVAAADIGSTPAIQGTAIYKV